MKFAVFDLDHTLLPVDSGENWSRWLVRAAGMDVALMDARIEAYAEAYRKGAFSADEFMGFQAGLLAACRRGAHPTSMPASGRTSAPKRSIWSSPAGRRGLSLCLLQARMPS